MSTYTQEEFEALKKAIATGSLRVRHGEKVIEYRSLREMSAILRAMEKSLSGKKSIFGEKVVPSWDS